MSGYQPDWDLDRLRGEDAEAHVRALRSALGAGAIEVKRDDQALKTGNLFIEHKCKRADGWNPSGIAMTKAENWAVVIWPLLLILPTWVMKALHERALDEGRKAECVVGSHPTQGALIPLSYLLPWASQFVSQPVAAARAELDETRRAA